MATIIDALIVTLGLDASAFKQGVRDAHKAREDLSKEEKKAADLEEKAQKEWNDRVKKKREGYQSLRSAVLEYFAVFTAGKDIVEFARNTLTADAATGRLAQNLGVSTSALSVWQSVVKQAGGSAEDANSSLQALVTTTQAMMVAGDYSRANYLQALGISPADLQNPLATLDKLHIAFTRMTGARAQFMGSAIGLNGNAINALRDPNYQANAAAALKAGVPNDDDAARAQKAQQQLVLMAQASVEMGRKILEPALPAVTALVHGLVSLSEWAQQHPAVIIGAFTGIAIAMGVATAAAAALSFALAPEATIMAGIAAAVVALGTAVGFLVDGLHRLGTITGLSKVGDAIRGFFGLKPLGDEPAASAAPGSAPARDIRGTVHDFFRSQGASEATTQGILAGITAESGGNYRARNATSGAYGIGQWLGARQTAFARMFGHDIHQSTLQEQLRFLWSELNGGDKGGRSVLSAGSSQATLSAYVNRFMRPGPGAAGDMRRGMAALSGGVQIGNMTVYSSASDANGLMADVRKSAQRYANVQNANAAVS